MGRANFDDVPRLDGLRNAAKWARPRRSGNAEYHGDFPLGPKGLGIRFRQILACDDRSQEAGLHRPGEIYRRSAKTKTSGGNAIVEELGQRTSQTDRSAARELRRQGRGLAARERDDVPDRRGSRREHGLAHSEQLLLIWIRNCCAGYRICSSQSWWAIQLESRFAKCSG